MKTKYSGLKLVTVGLLFFLQNFHIKISGVLVSIMPDFIGIALIFIGLYRMKSLNSRIKKELPILLIDFIINTFVFILNLYISILYNKKLEIGAVFISAYSVLGAIKGFLSCLIIYSIFKISTEMCIKENVNESVYKKCPKCMWSYMTFFFINIIVTEVTLLSPDFFTIIDSLMLIPNLFISIWAVMLCVHIHDSLVHKTYYQAKKVPDEVKNLIDNCDYRNEHLHSDDL
ncbi:MAG: hypothetical protein RR911_02845 [Oscillospiraceae bacterium]